MRNFISKYGLLALCLLLVPVLGFATEQALSSIFGSGATVNIENFNCDSALEQTETFGASADYCDGTEATDNRCVMDIYDLTVGANGLDVSGAATISGALTISGTSSTNTATSSIDKLDASIQQDLNWSNATTTDGEATVVVLLDYTHTGADLICTDAWLDLSTARGIWGGNLAVGTTTATGDSSLTSTSTATLIASTAVTTTTADLLNKQDEEGTNVEEAWVLSNGVHLVVTDTFDVANATSAASFTTDGGFAGVGKIHLNCRNRY